MFTFKGKGDAIIYEIMVDTTPTKKDGLCTPMGDHNCYDCDIRIISLDVDGSELTPNTSGGPRVYGDNDMIASRPLLGKSYSDVHLPLKANKKLVITLDTENGQNDVKVKLTFVYDGGGKVKLN